MALVQIAKAWQQSGQRQREDQEREAEMAEQKVQREIQRAALLASLGERGIVQNDQVPTVRTPSAPGIPSMNMPTARRLGDTGYSQDLTKTPEAIERAKTMRAEQDRQRRLVSGRALVRARIPDAKTWTDDQIDEWIENKDIREATEPPDMDPLTLHAAKRDYDIANPLPERGGGGSDVSWQVTQTDDGIVQVNPKTGEVRPVMQGGQQMQARQSNQITQAIATNRAFIADIDRAIKALEDHPEAVGITRGRVGAIDNHRDPKGVAARALVANIGSKKIHDRSGGAVSTAEFPRLAPFVPSVSEVSAAVAIQKLKLLRQGAAEETEALQNPRAQASSGAAPAKPGVPSFEEWKARRRP